MTDLLTDLTAATAGSRDLSDRVLWKLGRLRSRLSTGAPPYPDRPNPTVNLQDAVDLVPAEYWYDISRPASGTASADVGSTYRGHADGESKTPQLALCIALLKYMEKT